MHLTGCSQTSFDLTVSELKKYPTSDPPPPHFLFIELLRPLPPHFFLLIMRLVAPLTRLFLCVVFTLLSVSFLSVAAQSAPAQNLACGSFYQDILCREDCGKTRVSGLGFWVHCPTSKQSSILIHAIRHMWHCVLWSGVRHCHVRRDFRADLRAINARQRHRRAVCHAFPSLGVFLSHPG
jgi:hypothetical protein